MILTGILSMDIFMKKYDINKTNWIRQDDNKVGEEFNKENSNHN